MSATLDALPTDVVVHDFPSPSPLTIIGERAEQPLVLRIVGDINVGNRQLLKQRILDELHEGRRGFVLDLSECKYIDGSGLGVFVSIAKKIRDAQSPQGRLAIAGLSEDLMALFVITKLDTVLPIIASNLAAAIVAVGA